jgi:hypothetical protein
VIGESSKRAARFFDEGEEVVRLSTIETGSDDLRREFAAPSVMRGKGLASLGDSGEKEGNEVNDLSEAMEEAELDMNDEYFLGLTRTVPDLWLLTDVVEWCEDVRCIPGATSRSIISFSFSRGGSQSQEWNLTRSSSWDSLRTVDSKASRWHPTWAASVKAGLH